ncbi:MAG: glycoside hydrolase family 108 protein [Terriglobia bacterium]
MGDPFDQAIRFTLGPSIEGGVSNVAGDHGGLTNMGITQQTYDTYRAQHRLAQQPVTGVTPAEAQGLYRTMFWNAAHCPDLLGHLAIVHFDWAVNHSPRGAIETLQQALGVTADGLWGSKSAAACAATNEDDLVSSYLMLRTQWYQNRVADDPTQAKFLNGWLNRVAQLRTYVATLHA